MFEAEADVGIGGEVENEIAPGHRLRQRREVKVIAANEFEIRMIPRGRQKFILAGGKIVPADDAFAAGSRRSTRLLPMKPAAPVTNTLSMIGRGV